MKAMLLSPTCLFACVLAFAPMAIAQTPAPTPQMVLPHAAEPARVANETALACAGHIRYQPFGQNPEIVGAEEEQEQRTYSQGDIVYVNAGSRHGIKEGQTFQIIRPRGDVKSVHDHKVGFLGTYVQDIGQLEVFKVREETSAARITFTCETALLGDLIVDVAVRESPLQRAEANLDRFADPSGKQVGRLVMARDNREMLTERDIAYIDLGGEDNVKPGDYLTIYRPLGTGNVTRIDNEEMARNRSTGFQSDRYRGGGFSNQASRAKDSTAFVNAHGRYRYKPITSKQVKRDRPEMPRKIVGEMVILDVQTRTATVIITRVASEVHTGDWVEIQ